MNVDHEVANPGPGVADIFARLTAQGDQVRAHRVSFAAAEADALVADLVELAPARSDRELEDELCTRVGARLGEWETGPLETHVSPNQFVQAIITAAAAAVRAVLEEPSAEPDGWRAPWRVLAVVAGIVHFPLSAMAADVMEELRDLPGGHALPKAPDGPAMTGQVLWARDGYGSRFGVTAGFGAPDGPDRWYLWDIDACGHLAFTVHSAYYPTPEQAQAQWRAGVGAVAAGETAFTPVENPSLLAELLPGEEGFLRSGGENSAQLAEYHRSRRLAETVIRALEPIPPAQGADIDAATAATQFAAWLRAHRANPPLPADLDDLATELADSWNLQSPAEVYATCSPHRVALTVLHLRNYYQDDFAAQLVALLPDWICWLAEGNGTAPELVERCRPYALGETHPDVGSDDSSPNYQARVVE